MTTIETPTQFCEIVANSLGWVPTNNPNTPRYRLYMNEVKRLNKKIASNPRLFSWDNLLLTLEFLRRKRYVTSPTGVCEFVEEALSKAAAKPEKTSDLANEVRAAIAYESARQYPDSPQWIVRLTRATGPARREVLDEWKEARRDRAA